jgi:hypothetical protein
MENDVSAPEFERPDTAKTVSPDTSAAEKPDVDPARIARVKREIETIKKAKSYWKKDFDRMKKCMKIAKEGREDDWPESNYTVPIVNRHINVSVAGLYARNPTAVAKRRKKVMFKLWDGNFASLQQAMQGAQGNPGTPPGIDPATGQPTMGVQPTLPDPNAVALLQEVQQVHQQNTMMDRAGKTLEILFQYFMNEQDANYKEQLKAAVRRTKVCGVAWLKLGYQRAFQPNPDVTARIEDVTSQIATIKRLQEEQQEGELQPDTAQTDQLASMLAQLQSEPEIVVREGPTLGFPKATEVIVDTACRQLKTLVGAGWLAHEFPPMTPDEIEEFYGVDIKSSFQAYTEASKREGVESVAKACVWEVWNKKTQEVYTVCDGYPDFLRAPAAPDVKIERFFTMFPIVFNECEDDDSIYPPSDVWNARFMQREYNNIRQGLREHRQQNKPKYAAQRGALEDADKTALGAAKSGEVIELNGLVAGMKVDDLLQPIEMIGIDPNLYEVETVYSDMTRVVGTQQADLGQPGKQSATGQSIAENSRSTSISDNVDDLDGMLSDLARAMGQLMLLELDVQTVQEIAGPGAVWPNAPPTREQINKELVLDVKAGSSGRPNQAAELANMERALPYLLQIPGINPFPLGRRYGDLLDLDVDDIVIEGMPSIVAQNQMAGHGGGQPSTGNTATDPNQQGPKGQNNAPAPQQNEPGGQPAFPAPHAPGGPPMGGAPAGARMNVPAPAYKAQPVLIGPH